MGGGGNAEKRKLERKREKGGGGWRMKPSATNFKTGVSIEKRVTWWRPKTGGKQEGGDPTKRKLGR